MEKETAMEILRKLHDSSLFAERTALETIIPELGESEDEKIRKALIRFHKSTIDVDGIKGADIIAWLEKQGEQKPILDFKASNWYVSKVDGKIHDMTYNPTDKVEPKFKIGDILCDKSCTTLDKNSQPNIEILDIRNDMYICNNCSFPISQQDEYELVAKFDKYEGLTDFERTLADICRGWIGEEHGWKDYIIKNSFPLLELAKKQFDEYEQKPTAWSDEDEEMTEDLIKGCVSTEKAHHFLHTPKEVSDWLKSLKDRIICKNTI